MSVPDESKLASDSRESSFRSSATEQPTIPSYPRSSRLATCQQTRESALAAFGQAHKRFELARLRFLRAHEPLDHRPIDRGLLGSRSAECCDRYAEREREDECDRVPCGYKHPAACAAAACEQADDAVRCRRRHWQGKRLPGAGYASTRLTLRTHALRRPIMPRARAAAVAIACRGVTPLENWAVATTSHRFGANRGHASLVQSPELPSQLITREFMSRDSGGGGV